MGRKTASCLCRSSAQRRVGELLFILGIWWGRMIGVSPLRVGAGVALAGLALVMVTIALGG